MANLSGDLHAGHYHATSTVYTGRRNLFSLAPGNEYHIGTLISGSKSKLQRFDMDCHNIVRGLALVDVVEGILQALTLAEQQLGDLQRAQRNQKMTVLATDDALRAVTDAISKIKDDAHVRT
ncbi:MAG: hypothetical protein IH582_17085 [Afipia sp.]|nr:hypothetical protein [Afipia sp.]